MITRHSQRMHERGFRIDETQVARKWRRLQDFPLSHTAKRPRITRCLLFEVCACAMSEFDHIHLAQNEATETAVVRRSGTSIPANQAGSGTPRLLLSHDMNCIASHIYAYFCDFSLLVSSFPTDSDSCRNSG